MTAFEVNHHASEALGSHGASSAAVPMAGKTPFYRKLYVQVLIAVVLGAILGYAYPDLSSALKPIGDAFVRAIKVMVPPIIFTTIVVGIAKMGDIRRVANVGVKALIYFEVASTLALIIGMVVGNLWKVGVGLNADPAAFDLKVVEGYAKLAKNVTLSEFLVSASVALFGMVRIIMYFAPLAALCAMAFTVGKYGLRTLLELGQLVASVYVVSI